MTTKSTAQESYDELLQTLRAKRMAAEQLARPSGMTREQNEQIEAIRAEGDEVVFRSVTRVEAYDGKTGRLVATGELDEDAFLGIRWD
jgi:hypothetical protein